MFLLSPCSIAECCSTPYSLLGLVFTVSFIALGVLTLCKFYLQGYRAFMNDNTMHRSVHQDLLRPSCQHVASVLILLHCVLQGDDRRNHPADPGCPDWPHRASGHPPSLPPLHHPLHCCCFHPPVHAGDSRSHRPGPGSFQRQVGRICILMNDDDEFFSLPLFLKKSFKPVSYNYDNILITKHHLHPSCSPFSHSPIRSLWKHFRAVSLCLFLLIFPAYMAYMICQFFHMDFWLLIIISSSILTSLQVKQE